VAGDRQPRGKTTKGLTGAPEPESELGPDDSLVYVGRPDMKESATDSVGQHKGKRKSQEKHNLDRAAPHGQGGGRRRLFGNNVKRCIEGRDGAFKTIKKYL